MSGGSSLVRTVSASGAARYSLGHPLLDRYLEFVGGRSRPNTLRAVAFDLKAFFAVVPKDPVEVSPVDVFEFLAHRRGDRSVVRLSDRESGLAARTIVRRLSSVSGLYSYLAARGDTAVGANPVPRGLATRRKGAAKKSRNVPLVRVPRTLPKVRGAGRGGQADRCPPYSSRPGHGDRHGPRRAAPLRGARLAPGGHLGRGPQYFRCRGQRRPPTSGPRLRSFLCLCR